VASGEASPSTTDGRSARAERTRRAIVDALLELTAEGMLKPTGERIAERAGVSLRALWTNFKDLETLYAAAGDRLTERQLAEHRPVPPDLPLATRVAQFCRQRARLLEIIAPAARASALRLPFSAHLRRYRAEQNARVRREITVLFAAELDRAGAEREELLAGLLAASTWPVWSMLRDDCGLDVPAACAVMTRMVGALLQHR
jgi:TetR/AcrR family transcriptional regulator of autoinduction and epiphytic fitness